MTYFRDLWTSRELLLNLTMREITGRYKRTVLGQLWSLLNPLASMLVYTIVFGIIFRSDPGPGDPSGLDVFALWLLCGLLPFQFFQNAVNGGMGAIWANTALVKKVYFPRTNLVLAATFSAAFNWGIEMLILVAAILIAGAFVLPFVPLVIVFMVLFALLATGFGLVLAVVNVYFQDMQHIVGIALRLLMYLSPVVYPLSYVAARSESFGPVFGSVTILDIYQLNPLERYIDVFRQLLYDNRLPDVSDVVSCVAWTAGALAVGVLVFQKNEKRLAEML